MALADPPIFTGSEKPTDIVAVAGTWLAESLDDGFVYLRSKRAVVRKSRGRTESVNLQTSTWSRAGEGTWVMPRVRIADARVRDWQRGKKLTGLFASGGDIFNSLLINLGIGDVELFGPLRAQGSGRWLSLPEFLAVLKRDVMPNVHLMREAPSIAAEGLPSRWIVFAEPPFWWATAYGDRAAAKRFLARYFEANPRSREHFDKGRALASSDAEPPFGDTMVSLGWSAVRSAALSADEPI